MRRGGQRSTTPDRSKLQQGFKGLLKALWFLLALVLWLVGYVLHFSGSVLIRASGLAGGALPQPPPLTPRRPPGGAPSGSASSSPAGSTAGAASTPASAPPQSGGAPSGTTVTRPGQIGGDPPDGSEQS